MEAGELTGDVSFGQNHFGHCELGDKRLTDRLVHTADLFLRHPGGTLPDKLNRNADLIGFYRLANNKNVTHAKLIAAHSVRTRQLMTAAAGSIVLVIHDTTEIDFSGLDVDGLGQLGNGGCRGFLCHNSLAYDYGSGEALGLVGQIVQARREVSKKETPKQKREHPQRESRLWKKGWQAAGPFPGKQVVHVADRGGDLLEFIEAVDKAGEQYVIRSKSNRNIDLPDGKGGVVKTKLHDHARSLPDLGRRTVTVSTNKGHRGRTATVRIAAAEVSVRSPHFARGDHSKDDLPAWVIHVREVDPPALPAGEKPLEWILLTNVPAPALGPAGERVDWTSASSEAEKFCT